ncbi:KIF3A [Symbiodinium sp. CCMP2456]|nr:KIF3A [Symbiodinium sp. CCMP2456]
MLSTRHTTYIVYVPMSIVQMLWPATFFLFTSAQDAVEAALVEDLEQPASAPSGIHSLSVASSLPPLTLVGKHFDRVVRAADPTSEEWDAVAFLALLCLDERQCAELEGQFDRQESIFPSVASVWGVAVRRTVKVGGRFFGGRPSLAELRKLNVPGLDEQVGGQKKAFGGDASSGRGLRSGASCLDVLEKRSVLVAVRSRPFNEREKAASSGDCLSFQEETGMTLHREDDKDYRFAFDCVMRPETEQREVYDRTARPLLHKVLEGYNGCLFAYGQTGSGKTFTMQGSSDQKGIIPTLCTELFGEIKECADKRNITVVCSVLEIYNEKVRDLSVDSSDDLSIREDTAEGGKGIHVEGLTEVQVRSCEEVLDCIAKAQQRRAVGKTNMNEHSSRSHSVVTLRIGAYDCDDVDGATLTVSKLHLIDLAGSERQKATGATGDRLKEGAQINLSLSALGNVINALTERASGGRHIPYRDSKLTRMLQDSLGGNSYTVMICNVSPAKINVDETLSSLRFAERAKKIENKAVVNRDPKGERILELLQENKALRAKIARLEAHVDRLEMHYDK